MDETWLHHHDPQTNHQSTESDIAVHPAPRKFGVQKSNGKIVASIFWDQDGILLIDYIPKDQIIKGAVVTIFGGRIEVHCEGKRHFKVTKRVWFFHENAPTNPEFEPKPGVTIS
jgi:hypothetical protein